MLTNSFVLMLESYPSVIIL
nr:unnamed protein product [Callosobruchus analis]